MSAESLLHTGVVVDGRYRLEELIGSGGYGQVWRATRVVEKEDVGMPCAVKVMHLASSGHGSSGTGRTKWLEEARALAKVEAAGTTPRIFEANVWNDFAYIAMELLSGGTLRKRLDEGPVPWRRALFIAEQIAVALEAAHAAKIVHRDLKPENIILSGRRVCVIDWGIAHLGTARSGGQASLPLPVTDAVDPTDVRPRDPTARVPVMLSGTPGYMAPESYEHAVPNLASDVFALGVVLYEMLSGHLPHAVERPPSLADADQKTKREYRARLDQATQDLGTTPFVPIEQRRSGLPPKVAELVTSLLAVDPTARPEKIVDAIARASRFPNGVPDPPYAGLVAFGPEHAGLFFGQEATTQRVLSMLETNSAVLLWGPSGSGKSSLAAAGIAERMDRTLFLDMDGWRIHVVRPRDIAAVGPSSHATKPRGMGDVVVLDQLEEILDFDAAARRTFCESFIALVNGTETVVVGATTPARGMACDGTVLGPEDEVRVIATLRDDLEWKIDRDMPELRPLLERRVIAKGVDANFAEEIVAAPALAAGYGLEGLDAVCREVQDELSRDTATLPIIQFALSEWWARSDHVGKVMPFAIWKEIGGVKGALSFVAERMYRRLDVGGQRRLHSLMLKFFQDRRKQAVSEAELTDPQDLDIARRLVAIRLVRRRENENRAPAFEVEHEALALHWERLRRWLDEARADRLRVEEIEREAAEWASELRAPERLWRKGRLVTGVALLRSGMKLSVEAQAFLTAGRQAERVTRVLWGTAAFGALSLAVGSGALYVSRIESERAEKALALEDARKNLELAEQNGTIAAARTGELLKERDRANASAASVILTQQTCDRDLDRLVTAKHKEVDEIRREIAARRNVRPIHEEPVPSSPTSPTSSSGGQVVSIPPRPIANELQKILDSDANATRP